MCLIVVDVWILPSYEAAKAPDLSQALLTIQPDFGCDEAHST